MCFTGYLSNERSCQPRMVVRSATVMEPRLMIETVLLAAQVSFERACVHAAHALPAERGGTESGRDHLLGETVPESHQWSQLELPSEVLAGATARDGVENCCHHRSAGGGNRCSHEGQPRGKEEMQGLLGEAWTTIVHGFVVNGRHQAKVCSSCHSLSRAFARQTRDVGTCGRRTRPIFYRMQDQDVVGCSGKPKICFFRGSSGFEGNRLGKKESQDIERERNHLDVVPLQMKKPAPQCTIDQGGAGRNEAASGVDDAGCGDAGRWSGTDSHSCMGVNDEIVTEY